MKSIPIGSLVRDTEQGDIGIVVGTLVETPSRWPEPPGRIGRHRHHHSPGHSSRTQLVLWPSNDGEAWPMDLSAIESGWVEVVGGP